MNKIFNVNINKFAPKFDSIRYTTLVRFCYLFMGRGVTTVICYGNGISLEDHCSLALFLSKDRLAVSLGVPTF